MHPRFVLVGSAVAGFSLLTALDAAVKAGLLLGVAALVVLVGMRRAGAASRHLVWLCALTGALLLPFGFKLLPQWRVLPSWLRWEEAPRLFQTKPLPQISSHAPLAAPNQASETLSPEGKPTAVAHPSPSRATAAPIQPAPLRLHAWWFITAWLTGGALCLLPTAVSTLALRRTARQSRRLSDGPLFDAVAQVSRELGLRRMPILLLGNPSAMPMVWGVFRTSLLLPTRASEWSPQRLRAVLLHELSHLRRRDPLALWIAHLALAAHWFNPLAWLAVRQLRREQELACDDCVLRHGLQASDYASEMLEIATTQRVGVARLAALTMARRSGLESRVAGILDAARNRNATTRRWALGVGCVAVLVALPLAMLKAAPEASLRRGRLLDRNGLVLAESPEANSRVYPYRALAAHLIGYVKRDALTTYEGIAGVELLYDETLRAGKDITLALDARMQSRAENALRSAGIGRGAVVVVDCANGDLLATASFPAFDPNHFVPAISVERFKEYYKDATAPLSNRALMAHTPGSTFKLLTAMAACRAGHADAHHDCEGFIKLGNIQVGCWIWNAQRGKHGDLNLHDALTQSCNCYFMQAGQQIGIDSWVETGSLLGLGAATGSGLPAEAAGILPSPATQQARGIDRPWSPAATAIHAIGAGESQATPLQMAALLAGIGNGERLFVPRVNLADPPQIRVEFLKHGWRAEDLGVMRTALRDNVMEPGNVGGGVRSERIEIAGAPGTAQAMDGGKRSNNAWFVGYSPANAPRYAIAVLVQNGTSGGKIAGPIARQVLEDLQSELPPPTPQEPAKGHLNRVEPAPAN
jgi:beta-lactamase regulating signal transducer with metallopeptidase domain/beta-lactamase class D